MSRALLIVGHGSRDPEGIAEFLALARQLRACRPELLVEIAFLEFARPTFAEGLARLVQAGARQVTVLPGVLMAAGHAKNDLASEVRLARQQYPHLSLHMGRALEIDSRLLRLCKIRYEEALAGRTPDPDNTLLVLVGRGSSDPDANSNVAKVARFLQEGYPVAWATVAFSGITFPRLPETLLVCERLGFRRIVVQPYFLFTGVLLKRIHAQVAERQQARPDREYILTPHLQAHPLLLETFLARAEEAEQGLGHMNCSLCRYRVFLPGQEQALGEIQTPHHHHVQGLYAHHVHHLEETGSGSLPLADPPASNVAAGGAADSDAPHLWSAELLARLHFVNPFARVAEPAHPKGKGPATEKT